MRAKLRELKWLTLNQAVEKMRGPENSKIKLKIMRFLRRRDSLSGTERLASRATIVRTTCFEVIE